MPTDREFETLKKKWLDAPVGQRPEGCRCRVPERARCFICREEYCAACWRDVGVEHCEDICEDMGL